MGLLRAAGPRGSAQSTSSSSPPCEYCRLVVKGSRGHGSKLPGRFLSGQLPRTAAQLVAAVLSIGSLGVQAKSAKRSNTSSPLYYETMRLPNIALPRGMTVAKEVTEALKVAQQSGNAAAIAAAQQALRAAEEQVMLIRRLAPRLKLELFDYDTFSEDDLAGQCWPARLRNTAPLIAVAATALCNPLRCMAPHRRTCHPVPQGLDGRAVAARRLPGVHRGVEVARDAAAAAVEGAAPLRPQGALASFCLTALPPL